MTTEKKPLIYFIIFLIIFQAILIFAVNINRAPWGDEVHFIKTVRLFSGEINLENLRTYEELSPPLPFIAYGLWGRVFGTGMLQLRLLSVLVACFTYMLFFSILSSLFNNKTAFFTTLFLMINPYMAGLNIFVYTDMMSILFLIALCFAVIKRCPYLLFLSSAFLLLTRQYMIFLTFSAAVYYLISYIRKKEKGAIFMFVSCVVSAIPLLLLFLLWKGVVPDNGIKEYFLKGAVEFKLNFLVLYVSQLFVYLFPFALLCLNELYKDKKTLIVSLIISLIYFAFPIQAASMAHVSTVGLFHRALKSVLKNPMPVNAVFYFCFLSGLPILIFILRDIYKKVKENYFDFSFFLDLSVISFLLIMPFSYFCWEKYFLPLVPILSLRLLQIKYSGVEIKGKQ